MKKVALVIGIVVFVLLSLQVWQGQRGQLVVMVAMTGSGFSPRKVEAQPGAVIAFVNQDTVAHWPASDYHPDHMVYPQFDARGGIDPGGRWEFLVEKTGFFKFHDHLFPHSKGILIVNPSNPTNNPIRPIDKKTENGVLVPEKFRAMSEKEKYQFLKIMISQRGAVAAWQLVNSVYTASDATTPVEHNLSHFLGGKIFEEKGIAGTADCTPLFINGCYHGIADRVLIDTLDALPRMFAACESLRKKSFDPFSGCIHGIGHGIATFFEPPNLVAALEGCNRVKGYEVYCQGGVFMEYYPGAPMSDSIAEAQQRDPLAPCRSLAAEFRFSCFVNGIKVHNKVYGKDMREVIDLCLQEPEVANRKICIASMGHTVGSRSSGDLAAVRERCLHIKPLDLQAVCFTNAFEEIALQKHPGWERVEFACSDLPAAYQTNCSRVVREAITFSK